MGNAPKRTDAVFMVVSLCFAKILHNRGVKLYDSLSKLIFCNGGFLDIELLHYGITRNETRDRLYTFSHGTEGLAVVYQGLGIVSLQEANRWHMDVHEGQLERPPKAAMHVQGRIVLQHLPPL